MTELVERYVHQVGRYLPKNERVEIEVELRSQIQDKLDDRFAGVPAVADVAAVLAELGEPRRVAASYSGEQYLVGPALYPFMMMVLRHGWLLVPAIVVFLNVFGALFSSEPGHILGLLISTTIAALQATLIFSAAVVLLFAVMQHAGVELDTKVDKFDPLALPEVNAPVVVDRVESAFGVAFGTFTTLVMLYFLSVGGLTLRFNPAEPGNVIPSPAPWLILLILNTIALVVLHLVVLKRNRWTVGAWLADTALEIIGMIALYFAVLEPVSDYILSAAPPLGNLPLFTRWPEITAVAYIVIVLATRIVRLIKLLNDGDRNPLPFTAKTEG